MGFEIFDEIDLKVLVKDVGYLVMIYFYVDNMEL